MSKNLESTVRLVCPQADVRELPNADYVRKMRGIIRILTETLSAYELAKDKEWKHIYNDATSRCTTSMTTFDASIMKNNVICPILLDHYHTGLGLKSGNDIECIREVINNSNFV